MIFAINASNPTSLTRLLNSMASKRNIKANRIFVSIGHNSDFVGFDACINRSRKYRDRTNILQMSSQETISYIIDLDMSESVCFLTDSFSFTSDPSVCSNFIARSLRDKYDESFMFRYNSPSYAHKKEVSNRCSEFLITENSSRGNTIISGDVYLPHVLKLRLQGHEIPNLLFLPSEVMTRHD